MIGQLPPYNIRAIPLDTAQTDLRVSFPGNSLSVSTDGSLSGITITFDSIVSDAIPLARFKDFYFYPIAFSDIYVTFTAQSSKTLYLFIGRDQIVAKGI